MRLYVGALIIIAACGGAREAPTAIGEVHQTLASKFDALPSDAPFRIDHIFEPAREKVVITLGERSFTGHVEITGQLANATKLIWLHGVDLAVTRVVGVHDGKVVQLHAAYVPWDDQIGVQAADALAAGDWTLVLDYTAPIREQQPPRPDPSYGAIVDPSASGVFRRVVGKDVYVFTQGESIGARQIVPCIDEPDRKIAWELTLDVGKDLVAESNTAIVHETVQGDRKRIEFAPTLPLPSYLLAFAVGPFEIHDAGHAKNGTPMRVLAIAGHGDAAEPAAKALPGLLDGLEARIGVPYAFGKIDVVEVPHLGFGAMENPGLITVDSKFIADLPSLGHELAHQWFGNLVTPRWWDDLWLSESFATFLSDELPPDPVAERLAAETRLSGYHVRHAVVSPGDLSMHELDRWKEVSSGAAVLQILDAELGEDFWRAVRHYVVAHARGNVTTDDLMADLVAAAGSDREPTVRRLLDEGLPALTATVLCDGPPRLYIGVTRELTVCTAYDRDGKRAETCGRVDQNTPTLPLPARACPRWAMPNPHGHGLYKTAWTEVLVKPLLGAGLAQLLPEERALLFGEIVDDDLKLAIYIKLAAANAPTLFQEAAYLRRIAPYVPDDLRAPFDAWVARRTAPVASPQPKIEQLLSDLAQGIRAYERHAAALDTLAAMPDVIAVFEQHPDELAHVQSWDRIHVFENVCDAAGRARLAALVQHDPEGHNRMLFANIDACIARRAQLAPIFRSWLGTARNP